MILKSIPWKALGVFTLGLVLGLYLGAKGAVKSIIHVFDSESVSKSLNKPTNSNTTTLVFKDNKFKKTDSINLVLSQKTKPVQEISLDSCDCFISNKEFLSYKDRDKRRIKKILDK